MDLPTDRTLNETINAALSFPNMVGGGGADARSDGERVGVGDWGAILNSGSPLKLLYSLQILARKFETHGAKGDAARASFCGGGGLAHLCALLAASGDGSSSGGSGASEEGDGSSRMSAFFATPLSTSSLALLLRLVNELRGAAAGATDAEEWRAEAARMLSSMLQLLRACSLQSGARRAARSTAASAAVPLATVVVVAPSRASSASNAMVLFDEDADINTDGLFWFGVVLCCFLLLIKFSLACFLLPR